PAGLHSRHTDRPYPVALPQRTHWSYERRFMTATPFGDITAPSGDVSRHGPPSHPPRGHGDATADARQGSSRRARRRGPHRPRPAPSEAPPTRSLSRSWTARTPVARSWAARAARSLRRLVWHRPPQRPPPTWPA